MTVPRHQRVYELFVQACDLPADQRAVFLSTDCAQDETLDDAMRSELKQLLALDAICDPVTDAAERAVVEAIAAALSDGGANLGMRHEPSPVSNQELPESSTSPNRPT